MKEIKMYIAEKYKSPEYEKIEEGIYKTLEKRSSRCFQLKGVSKEEAEEVRKLNNWVVDEKHDSFCVVEYNGKRYYKENNNKEGNIIYEEAPLEEIYVTSLSFVQEPEYDEGTNATDISQYPLEDVLDKFSCYISDFYEDINVETSNVCIQEFASKSLENIKNLLEIIDKHVYNKEEDGYVKLIIE